MSLKDIDIGIKKIKLMLINDIEKQLRFLGISYDKIYTSEEIKNGFDVNRKYKRNQVLDVLMNECENDEAGSLLNDIKIRKKNLKKFIRECAFDFTNKFCAIRLLEERNLISPTIKKFKEYGDKSEVQKNLSRVSYALLDKDPYDGLKHAIEGILRELSTQIKLLFELNDEHSLLFPGPKTIKEITKVLLDEIPSDDWNRDDFVGWTYQYFVEDEKEEIEQADTPEEIAAKTQVYTYDWIVKYIVDNTLGSYWNEIESGKRPQQEVETIKLIDPSCGSGSFLTYAFDKYYELYVEEGKIPEEQIPNYIISKNILGMDIDERAVQLAALNLYIKAKEKNRNSQIEKFNIICTDSRIKGEVNIDKYLMSISIDPKLRNVIENIVRKSFDYMQENNLLGSLMKIEDVINPIIDEYVGGRRRPSIREVEAKKEKILKQSDQTTMFKAEVQQLSLDSIEDIRYFESREEFVEYLRQKILDCVDYVVTKINKYNDINSRMFAKDLSKGSNFIGAMMQKYEVVVGNPPYLHNRKMGNNLRNCLNKKYESTKTDLYSAFIEKTVFLNRKNGYTGLLTPDTYLNLIAYSSLRNLIVDSFNLKIFIHLGKVFNNVAVSLGISIFNYSNQIVESKFIDITNINNKKNAIYDDKYISKINLRIFKQIGNCQFIYSMPDEILKTLIDDNKLVPKYALCKPGIKTADNYKFVYMYWEIKQKLKRWKLYLKGGSQGYFNDINNLIDWNSEAQNFYKENKNSRIREQAFRFKEGITYSVIGGKNFSARFMKNDSLYDVVSPAIFPKTISIKYLLGFLNSKLCKCLLWALNPTISFTMNDIENIPFKIIEDDEVIEDLVNFIMLNKMLIFSRKVNSYIFQDHIDIKEIFDKKYLLNNNLETIFIEESSYIINEILLYQYGYNEQTIDFIKLNFGRSIISLPIIKNYYFNPKICNVEGCKNIDRILSEHETIGDITKSCERAYKYINNYYCSNIDFEAFKSVKPSYIEYTEEEIIEITNKIRNLCMKKGSTIISISEELKINPRSVLAIMEKNDLYIEEDLIETVKRYLQSFARKAFDDDRDGIVLLSELVNKIHDELDKTFGESASFIETEIVNIIGKSIEKWLRDDFAIDYINNKGYDKKKDKYKEIRNPWEPLIWKGQSSKKNFTVFVWRYKITPDTELKIRSQYLDSEIESYENKIKELDERLLALEGKEKSNLEKEKDEIFYILDDLNEYKEWIKENGVRLRGMWFNWE
ncbi:DNA methyltransferase [Clostridium sp. 001]|uniref:Eco57I restriction-modification methylase domain-containing protein n=1 Tax=Clostridium sp. 001 TaxID=1970093 RepID=UPI001C2C18A6|nr:DNA methyltransferase [Clostridium sp. 001]QXE17804.1 hypothetical protein B5S50_02495 [Clostridium sp. 001]